MDTLDASPGYSMAAGPAFWVDGFDDWHEKDIPRRPWIVPGYLMRGTLTIVVGSPAAGKSLLALLWSTSLSLGLPVGKFRPLPGLENTRRRVLIINAEDDANEQRRRIAALIRQFNAKPRDLEGWLTRAGPEKVASLFERDAQTGKIVPTAAMSDLRVLIREGEAEVVVLDPLVELTTGIDENSNTDLKQVLAELRALAQQEKVAILLVHHLRKGTATPGDLESARGASSIVGAVRAGMTLVGMTEDEANAMGITAQNRRHYVRLDDGKQSYAALGDAEWFERIGIELANGDWAPTLMPWQPPHDVVTPEIRSAVESGIARGSLDGPWSPTFSSRPRSVSNLMTSCGVTTKDGQKRLLTELCADGFAIDVKYHSKGRKDELGIRSPSGKPDNVRWLDGASSE
jgi:hypothetical protein